jgi:hypothetical protein
MIIPHASGKIQEIFPVIAHIQTPSNFFVLLGLTIFPESGHRFGPDPGLSPHGLHLPLRRDERRRPLSHVADRGIRQAADNDPNLKQVDRNRHLILEWRVWTVESDAMRKAG